MLMETNLDEFISQCAIRFCPECGKEIVIDRKKANGRPRKFCSDACRRKFWKAHPNPEKWDSFEKHICPICGEAFFAAHENRRERKYCSRACANKGRALKGEEDE